MKTTFWMITIFFLLCLSGCKSNFLFDKSNLTPVLNKISEIEKVEEDYKIRSFKDPKTNLIGFKDQNGKVLIPPQYSASYEFNKYGIADVLLSRGLADWYKINKSGKLLVKSYFFDNGPDYYVTGLSRYEKDGKVGFVNFKGDIIIPAQFDWASTFSYSIPISLVCIGCAPEHVNASHVGCCHPEIKGGKWGIIDIKGNILVPLDFSGFTIENNILLMVKGAEKYQVYNKVGKLRLIKIK